MPASPRMSSTGRVALLRAVSLKMKPPSSWIFNEERSNPL